MPYGKIWGVVGFLGRTAAVNREIRSVETEALEKYLSLLSDFVSDPPDKHRDPLKLLKNFPDSFGFLGVLTWIIKQQKVTVFWETKWKLEVAKVHNVILQYVVIIIHQFLSCVLFS